MTDGTGRLVVVRFADVTLDLESMEVERGGDVVPVEPQVFDVLAYLVRHRDRLVPRIELLDEVWGDRFVSDSALSSRIKSARRAIGDNGRDQRLIKTVHGRGFRFVGEIRPERGGVERSQRQPVPGDADAGPAGAFPPLVASVLDGVGVASEIIGPSAASRRDAVDEILAAAGDAGLLVGRGGATGENRPYGPVLDAIEEWLQRRADLLDDIPRPCAAELTSVLAQGASGGRQRLFVAMRELFVAAARRGGAVLAVDDVHFIDRPTLDLVVHLARAARRVPAAVVVSHRPGFVVGEGLDVTELDGAAPEEPDAVPPAVAGEMRVIAELGDMISETELAVAVADPGSRDRVTAIGVASGLLETDAGGWRWVSSLVRERLAAELPLRDRVDLHRRVAERLVDEDGPPGRIADHLHAAGDHEAAAPYDVVAAVEALWGHENDEVLRRTSDAATVRDPATRSALAALGADARSALGDPDAVRWYREALRSAPPSTPTGDLAWLRTRLAREHLFAGDLASATEALDGVEPDGGPYDGGILLVRGSLAYFEGDMETAEHMAEAARPLALAPGAPDRLLDVIALEGMIAHSRGEWFDRLRHEIRATSGSSELTGTVFDSHLCVSQFLLYGPTEHDDVKRYASGLRSAAEAAGSKRAVGFAATLFGEAALMSGELEEARASLTDAVELHREMGASTGLAHAMQRLAEVELAIGDREAAERRCRQALPMARWSPLSRHLIQRLYGTLIEAAPDDLAAIAVVDEAMDVLDGPGACEFCQITIDVPATIACANAGHLDDAVGHLERAAVCAERYEGTAWPAAVAEARAVVARAEGRIEDARRHFDEAARDFDLAGHVLDVERCREAADEL